MEAGLEVPASAEGTAPGTGETLAEAGRSSPPSAPPLDEQRVFRDLLWLCGIPIALSVVHTIVVRVSESSALVELVAVGTIFVVAVVGAVVNRRLVVDALRWPKARDLLATVVLGLALVPTLGGAFKLLERLGFTMYDGYLEPYAADDWPIWVGYLDVALVTPLAEELLFRGLIQPKLGQIISTKEALFVQAALFSALHLSPLILVTHFALGLAFGWLRLRSHSLLPGILLHGAWNALVVWSSLL